MGRRRLAVAAVVGDVDNLIPFVGTPVGKSSLVRLAVVRAQSCQAPPTGYICGS